MFSKLQSLPIFIRLKEGEKLENIREIPTKNEPHKEANLLLWAIGLPILISAIAHALKRGACLDDLIKRLHELDQQNVFQMSNPATVWYMVAFDAQKNRILPSKKRLSINLMIYLLGWNNDKEYESSIEGVLKARMLPESNDKWIGFSGNIESVPTNLELPEYK